MHSWPAQSIADSTARILLETGAIQCNFEHPYTLTSGVLSPVYVDCRLLISAVHARRALIDMAEYTIYSAIGFEQINAIAGGETAGIPFAAWLADRLMLPMQYVRKKPKGFGKNAQIEGLLVPGARVLLVEDLATNSRSKINFVHALRLAQAQVSDIFVIFHYGIFAESTQQLEQLGITLHALATWHDVLRVARQKACFDTVTLERLQQFLNAPQQWHA